MMVLKYDQLTVAQRAASLECGLKEAECPGTPIITATASFDSLCASDATEQNVWVFSKFANENRII